MSTLFEIAADFGTGLLVLGLLLGIGLLATGITYALFTAFERFGGKFLLIPAFLLICYGLGRMANG